ELAAYLFHHRHGGLAYGCNSKRREYKRNHSAYKQTGQYVCTVNINTVNSRNTYKGCEKCQCGKRGRGYSKTFTRSGSCVPYGIQDISPFADFFRKVTHFGNTPGIIGNGSESINGKLHGCCRHHTGSCNSYTVKSGTKE